MSRSRRGGGFFGVNVKELTYGSVIYATVTCVTLRDFDSY